MGKSVRQAQTEFGRRRVFRRRFRVAQLEMFRLKAQDVAVVGFGQHELTRIHIHLVAFGAGFINLYFIFKLKPYAFGRINRLAVGVIDHHKRVDKVLRRTGQKGKIRADTLVAVVFFGFLTGSAGGLKVAGFDFAQQRFLDARIGEVFQSPECLTVRAVLQHHHIVLAYSMRRRRQSGKNGS